MGICFIIGMGLGTLTQWVVDSQIKQYKEDNPIPEDYSKVLLAEEASMDDVDSQDNGQRDGGEAVLLVDDTDRQATQAA